jgi:hypothetical protein
VGTSGSRGFSSLVDERSEALRGLGAALSRFSAASAPGAAVALSRALLPNPHPRPGHPYWAVFGAASVLRFG